MCNWSWSISFRVFSAGSDVASKAQIHRMLRDSRVQSTVGFQIMLSQWASVSENKRVDLSSVLLQSKYSPSLDFMSLRYT